MAIHGVVAPSPLTHSLVRAAVCLSVCWLACWALLVQAGDASPSPRIAPGLASVGESLWLFGGRHGVDMGEGALDELWRFDSASLRWTLVQQSTAQAGGPSPRSFHQMVGGTHHWQHVAGWLAGCRRLSHSLPGCLPA